MTHKTKGPIQEFLKHNVMAFMKVDTRHRAITTDKQGPAINTYTHARKMRYSLFLILIPHALPFFEVLL